jgi:hypothetical protein
MDKSLQEFLEIGPSTYCHRHHLSACHICTRVECVDNTNPVVKELIETRNLLKRSVEQTEQSQKNTDKLLKLVNEMKGYLK